MVSLFSKKKKENPIIHSKLRPYAVNSEHHGATLLQIFTISVLFVFPHPYVPSERPGSGRNDSKSMLPFGEILLMVRCNSLP